MSKETIHYKCGHTGVANLCGRVSDRARKAKWIGETRDCPDCEEKARTATRQAENEAAAKANAAAGLPALTGTPKQIAWAESIRAKALAADGNSANYTDAEIHESRIHIAAEIARKRPEKLEEIHNMAPGADIGEAFLAEFSESIDLAIAAIKDEALAAYAELVAKDEAKWWIDYRSWNESHVADRVEKVMDKWVLMIAAGEK